MLFMQSARIQVFQSHFIAEFVLIQKVHHVRLVIPQCLHSMEYINSPLMSKHFTNNTDCTKCPTAATSIQAMYNCASLSPVIFFLPLLHLADELQKGAFRNWSVSVHGPSQELELLHHPIAVLGSGCIINSEYPTDYVFF